MSFHGSTLSDDHCTTVQRDRAACTCGWRSPSSFFCASRFATWHNLAVGETIDNPYLRAFLSPPTTAEIDACLGHEFLATRMRRDRLTSEYAWAIPTEISVRRLAELSPICDLGCGTGYWAKLLADVGAAVLAVDACPPLEGDNHHHREVAGLSRQKVVLRHFTDVVKGDARSFVVPADHALMLCWPPYNSPMATWAIDRYRGDRVIYIGEGAYGCTADAAFHERLDKHWDLTATYEIPQWDGLHDEIFVYARRSSCA